MKIGSVHSATGQIYLLGCVNDFCYKNNKITLFVRCRELVVIVVVAINSQYFHAVHLFRRKIYNDGQLFIQFNVRIMRLASEDN